LERVLRAAQQEAGAKSACVHVWQQNEEAKMWYEARGFVQREWLPAYYSKLRPGGAWVLWRDLS
jgi:ribosomal protein S18 acetylase RimI-like enzyme